MPTYDIKNPALGVDLTIESNRELGMQDFYDILKSRVTPQKMLQAYERGDKQLAMEALDHGFFETGVGFMDAIGPAAESMGRGLQKIAYQGSGEDAVRLLHDHYKTSNYGNPGKYGNKWNEPVTKAAKWFGGLIDSENFTKGDVDVTANLWGLGGGFNLAVPDMAKTRRKVEKHLPAALAYAGLPDDKDMRARVVQRALGVEASKEAATRGQAAVEALGGYNLIGAMGKQGIDIVAGDWTEEGLKTAELDYLVKKYQTIDAMERGAEIAAANGGAARTLARGFGLPVDAKLDEQTYEDVVSGAAEPDRDVAMVQSLAMSPDMYLTAGAAGLYNTLRTSVKRGAILGAGRELLDGDEVVLALRAAGASADDPALVAAIESSEAAAKKLDELTQKAQQAAAQAVPHLSPEGQAIVAKALEASPIKAPLLNRAAGQALEKAGVGVEYVGRLAEFLNRWPQEQLATFLIGNMGVSEKVATNTAKALTKGLVTASYAGGISGFDPEVTDVLVGILVANPYLVTRLGADAAIVGRQMKMPPSATSLYARIGALPEGDGSMMAVQVDREGGKVLSHAETTAQLRQLLAKDRKFEPTPVTRFAAQTLARTGIGPTLSRFASGAQTAAAASSIPAAFGYAIGGAEGAGAAVGASWPFIGFGMAAGTLARYASMADVHARVQGSIAYAKDMLPPAQKEVFNALKPEAQRAFAVSWEMYPDVEYKFRQGKGSSFYTTDGGNSRVVVYADDAPANQFRALLAHEVSHHIEHSGIGALVDKLLLGDLDLKQPGIFTKKINGSPVFRYAPGQENPVGYMYDDTFAALRENYLERVASAPDISPEHLRILESNPHIIAREIFAEQGAASILTPKSIRRANAGVAEKSFRSLARTLTGNPVVRKFAHRIGLPTERQSRKIPSMVFKDFKEIPAIQRMLEDYNEGVLGLSPSARKRKRILVDEDEVAQVIFDAKELLTEDTVSRLKSGGHLAMDENGNVRTDSTGRPIFLPVREVNANNRALSNDIIDILENSERQGIEFDDGHLTLEENASGKKTAVGRFLDDSVIDQLAKTNRYNPEQIQMLRKISRSLREQSGDVYDLFYYSALKWNRSGRKVYGQIRGGDRRSIPFGIKVTQDGNLVIETISLDAFDSNVSWLANHPTWGRKMEIAFGAATKNEAIRNLNEMLPRYLQNQIKGIKNGEEGSNVTPDQRDLINAAIGKVNKAHVAENPILEGMGQRKTDRQQSYRSRRLDRIGNALKTETGFPVDITRIGKNLNPVRQHLPAAAYHGTPHTFKAEEGAPLGRFREDKIGTGEGAAAYGHGLYFAEKKEVAEHYREQLAPALTKNFRVGTMDVVKDEVPMDYSPDKLKRVYGGEANARAALVESLLIDEQTIRRAFMEDGEKGAKREVRKVIEDFLDSYEGEATYEKVGKKALDMPVKFEALEPGSLYKVELAPKENEYLYWDKPFAKQPPGVRKKLIDAGIRKAHRDNKSDFRSPMSTRGESGEAIYAFLAARTRHVSENGNVYYSRVNDDGVTEFSFTRDFEDIWTDDTPVDALASKTLKEAGIPGIKYLDGDSRGKGKGDYNYVIFDEADVAITDKLFMPASEAGAGKGKQAEAAKLWQEKGTDSPYFKKWFGKSKVVDENGEPLVVYHGTPQGGFTSFDRSKAGVYGDLGLRGKGFYFTDSKGLAKLYEEGHGKPITKKQTYEVFLKLENPYDANLDPLKVINSITDKKKLTERLKQEGFDGVDYTYGYGQREIVAFSPEQIKSATGNRGTFDAGERNILFMPASKPLKEAASAVPDSWVDATGDVVRGDTIKFTESVFGGSYKNPKYLGDREIVAEVLNDSYGADKQQHTFSLKVISSSGTQSLEVGKATRRKGRNVYRNGTERLTWENEKSRDLSLDEKHRRGDAARSNRRIRKSASPTDKLFMPASELKKEFGIKQAEEIQYRRLFMPSSKEGEDYRGYHKAPDRDNGAPLHDVTSMYPSDIYGPNGARYYGTGDSAMDAKSIAIIQEMYGNPDGEVTIYRAVPEFADEIRPNDWVTIVREYAELHGESGNAGGDGYKILSEKVKASELFTEANSLHEWGWSPEDKSSKQFMPADRAPGPPDKQATGAPKSIRKALAGEPGGIASRAVTIDKALAGRLFMPAAAAYFDPGFSPDTYVGKKAFPMMADRMKTGTHVTRSNNEYELRGGPDHPDMPINQGKVAWASMAGGQAAQLQNAINRTDGIGLVTLMAEDALASNRTFARIIMDELRYDFENNPKARKALPKRIKDAAKAVRKWAKDNENAAYKDFNVKTLGDLEAVYPKLSFDVRKLLFKKIAAIDYKRKVGGIFWLDLVRELSAYKNEDGYRTGDIVKVIQFDQGDSVVNLADLGISPDPTYDVSFKGKSISNVKGRVSAFQVFRDGFDMAAKEANKPGRTMTSEGKVGPNAFRTMQMRGLTDPNFTRVMSPGSLEARNYAPIKFSAKTGPERASLKVRDLENLQALPERFRK